MKKSAASIERNRTVVLYVNEHELIVRPDGTVVSGVRAEVVDLSPIDALAEARPRGGEFVANAGQVQIVIRDAEGQA